jgi:hypothetical protein
MEYVPEGLTKAQWKAIKDKEAEALRKKKMGLSGTTRFKSRSFEAWQKAGGKHLFPVDPRTTPYEERPYMQRGGGSWDGEDLKKKGMVGRGQGSESKKNSLDTVYEGRTDLNSVSILGTGPGLPWTGKDLQKQFGAKKGGKPVKSSTSSGVAAKKLTNAELEKRKKQLFKPIKKETAKKNAAAAAAAEGTPKKKKGLFGF